MIDTNNGLICLFEITKSDLENSKIKKIINKQIKSLLLKLSMQK